MTIFNTFLLISIGMLTALVGMLTGFTSDTRGFLIEGAYGLTEKVYRIPDRVGNIYPDRLREGCVYDKDGRLLRDTENKYSYNGEGNK